MVDGTLRLEGLKRYNGDGAGQAQHCPPHLFQPVTQDLGCAAVWFYLFGQNEHYPAPLAEIKALATLHAAGGEVYLKLSARDDAPLKNAEAGGTTYLCTRDRGRWLVHGEAVLTGSPYHGETPASMSSIYGASLERRWWRRLAQVVLYPKPRGEADLGLAEGTLPKAGQAHVIHVRTPAGGIRNDVDAQSESRTRPELTELMDEAWEAGRLTPEGIGEAIQRFRKAHPYGR